MELAEFLTLPRHEVAQLVRQAGTKVCVFPVKGTRRWFMLENPSVRREDFASAYIEAVTQRSIDLYQLIFDLGVETLLTPSFSPNELTRGAEYTQIAVEGLASPATHPDFQRFCRDYEVRVRFYGDYRKYFASTPYAYLSELYETAMARTASHTRHRLFIGMFAHDPTETIAELAIRHHREHGHTPDKRTLIQLYYGEHVEPVDLFIGFGKFRTFDMPLVATGREDLYFTVSPSLYLTEPQLREILYDHLFARIKTKVDLGIEEWASMRDFYEANMGRTMGVGTTAEFGVWYPLPQVTLPPQMEDQGPKSRGKA